ncbi:MAG TPA: anti-sigma factor [Bryobacteraceae bacterium]|jgi:anti-sigma factor RsiW
MNCGNWEERIALYLGGDLDAAEGADVERHLAECVGCQVFASGMKDTLALLRDVHREEIAPAHFTAVRARVLDRLAGGRKRSWVWGLAAAAALAVVLALAIAPRGVRQPQHVAVVTPAPPPPPPRVEAQIVRAKVAPRPRPRRRVAMAKAGPKVQAPPAAEPLVVKMETSDPNVIIYWQVDSRGE